MPKQIAQYDYHSLANLSADGKRSLAIGKGKFKHNPDVLVDYATVFDTETGAIIAQYTDYLNPKAMSLSPDGKKAVFVYQTQVGGPPQDPIFDYLLIIWNTENNTSGDCNAHPKLQIADVAWLDDDRFVAMRLNGYSSVELTIYDVKSATLSQFDYKGYGSWMAVNGNIAIDMENQINLINPNTGAEIKRLSFGVKDRPAKVHRSLFYAPDGNLIATLQEMNNKAILVWDVVGDAPPIELKGDKYVSAIAWSPDSKQILSAEKEDDGVSRIYIWDIDTGEKKLFTEVREVLYERYDWVESLHWHGNNVYITLLRSMMVWEVEKGEQEKPKQIAQYDSALIVSLSADGERAIAFLMDDINKVGIVVLDTKTGREIKRYSKPGAKYYNLAKLLAFSPDGQHVLILERLVISPGGADEFNYGRVDLKIESTITIWNIEQDTSKTHTSSYTRRDSNAGIFDAIWLDNIHILLLYHDNLILWNVASDTRDPVYSDHLIWNTVLYNGEMVILWHSGDRRNPDALAFINPNDWNMIRPRESLTYKLNELWSPIMRQTKPIVLSPNRQYFAMLLDNKTTLAIRPVNDPIIQQTWDTGVAVKRFAWSPDSTKIVLAEHDETNIPQKTWVWIWDVATGKKTPLIQINDIINYRVNNLHWHGNKIYISASQYSHTVMVWEV